MVLFFFSHLTVFKKAILFVCLTLLWQITIEHGGVAGDGFGLVYRNKEQNITFLKEHKNDLHLS